MWDTVRRRKFKFSKAYDSSASRRRWRNQSARVKANPTLIPGPLQKPLQLFHLKKKKKRNRPGRSDSNPVFKWKRSTKAELGDERGAENSWAQDAAKSCVSSPLLLFSLEDTGWGGGGERRERSSLRSNPLSAGSDAPIQCFEAALSFSIYRGVGGWGGGLQEKVML